MRTQTIGVMVVLALIAGSRAPDSSAQPASPPPAVAFDAERAYRHVVELAVSIGLRTAGSPQEEDAAQYVAQTMSALGFPVEIRTFPIFYWENRSSSLSIPPVSPGAQPRMLDHGVVMLSPATAQELRLPVAHAGLGRPEDFRGKDVAGKAVLMQRGDLFFGEKVTNAAAAGAALAIIYNNNSGEPTPAVVLAGPPPVQGPLPIPGVFISFEEGRSMLAGLSAGVTVSFSLDVVMGRRTSRNIIATKSSADPRAIYLLAHMDTWGNSPGANDNASGVAVLLELARVIKDRDLDVTIRFIFTGAHETMTSGAEFYARTMAQEELRNAFYAIDLDMVGWRKGNALAFIGFGQWDSCLKEANPAFAESRAARDRWLSVKREFFGAEGCAVSFPTDGSFFRGRGVPIIRWKTLSYDRTRERSEDDPNHHLPSDDLGNVSPATLGFAGAVLELVMASHRRPQR